MRAEAEQAMTEQNRLETELQTIHQSKSWKIAKRAAQVAKSITRIRGGR
jgi:hypothetical protein